VTNAHGPAHFLVFLKQAAAATSWFTLQKTQEQGGRESRTTWCQYEAAVPQSSGRPLTSGPRAYTIQTFVVWVRPWRTCDQVRTQLRSCAPISKRIHSSAAQLAPREPISLPHATPAGRRPCGPVSPPRHCLVSGRRAGCFSGSADGGGTSRATPLCGRLRGGACGCRPVQTERPKAPDWRTRRSSVGIAGPLPAPVCVAPSRRLGNNHGERLRPRARRGRKNNQARREKKKERGRSLTR